MSLARFTPRAARGVSLIEALVALAIMAIGMLGIVGVQSTLRSTSDVAKQRSEAVRIAQEEIERWRGFMALAGPAATTYGGLLTSTPLTFTGVNATYTRTMTVTDSTSPAQSPGKSVKVNVAWVDRSAQTQSVELSTLIAGISPELGATLMVPVSPAVLQQPGGRKGGIPFGAKDLGGGRSGWIPPGSPTGTAWVFNNITGVITLCTTTAATVAGLIYDATAANNVVCTANLAIYIGGFVRYALDPMQPTPANAASAPSQPIDAPASNQVTVEVQYGATTSAQVQACYVRHINAGAGASYSDFNCAVPVVVIPTVPLSWSGKLAFGPAALVSSTLSDAAATRTKVCRYHGAASYALQKDPLANQNFLFIISGDGGLPTAVPYLCPTPLPAHQPAT